MSASGSLAEYGIKHLSVSPLTADSPTAAAPVYGTAIDVPGIQSFSYELNYTSETLTGDDRILATQSALESASIDIEFAKVSHAVKAIIEGGTHTLASTPSGKSSSQYALSGGSEAQYFRIDAVLTKTDTPNTCVRVVFYKCKLNSAGGERAYGAFKTNSFSCEAVACASNDRIYDEFELEGSTTDDSLMDAPQISSVSPIDGAAGVAASANVVVTFDRAMDDDYATTAFFSLYDVTASTSVPIGTPSYASNAFTLNPSSDLTTSHVIRLTVSGAVRDANGNPMGAPYVTTFTVA